MILEFTAKKDSWLFEGGSSTTLVQKEPGQQRCLWVRVICVNCELYYRGYHLLNPVEFLRTISTSLGWNYFSKSKFGWNMNLFHSSIHITCVETPVNVEEIVESTLIPHHTEEMYKDEVEANNTVFEFTVKGKGITFIIFFSMTVFALKKVAGASLCPQLLKAQDQEQTPHLRDQDLFLRLSTRGILCMKTMRTTINICNIFWLLIFLFLSAKQTNIFV